jgi:hypothetical protein
MGDADISTVIASLRSEDKDSVAPASLPVEKTPPLCGGHRQGRRCHFSFSSRAGRPLADAQRAMTEINLGTTLTVHSS